MVICAVRAAVLVRCSGVARYWQIIQLSKYSAALKKQLLITVIIVKNLIDQE